MDPKHGGIKGLHCISYGFNTWANFYITYIHMAHFIVQPTLVLVLLKSINFLLNRQKSNYTPFGIYPNIQTHQLPVI